MSIEKYYILRSYHIHLKDLMEINFSIVKYWLNFKCFTRVIVRKSCTIQQMCKMKMFCMVYMFKVKFSLLKSQLPCNLKHSLSYFYFLNRFTLHLLTVGILGKIFFILCIKDKYLDISNFIITDLWFLPIQTNRIKFYFTQHSKVLPEREVKHMWLVWERIEFEISKHSRMGLWNMWIQSSLYSSTWKSSIQGGTELCQWLVKWSSINFLDYLFVSFQMR